MWVGGCDVWGVGGVFDCGVDDSFCWLGDCVEESCSGVLILVVLVL